MVLVRGRQGCRLSVRIFEKNVNSLKNGRTSSLLIIYIMHSYPSEHMRGQKRNGTKKTRYSTKDISCVG